MRLILIIATMFAVLSCKDADFAGRAGQKQSADQKGNDAGDAADADDDDEGDTGKNGNGKGGSDGNGGKDGGGLDSDDDAGGGGGIDSDDDAGYDGGVETDDDDAFAPKKCTTTNIAFATGTANCPAHFAAYTADDSRSPQLGCCPLPMKNILKKDAPVARQTCLNDEVATGVQGGDLMCTKINTAKYKLNTPSLSCYVGDGASGGQGSTPCGVPPETLTALVATFGSDACIGQPFGALIVGRTTKYCTGVTSAQLLDAGNNQAVIMFKP